jgi:hypothetical protein
MKIVSFILFTLFCFYLPGQSVAAGHAAAAAAEEGSFAGISRIVIKGMFSGFKFTHDPEEEDGGTKVTTHPQITAERGDDGILTLIGSGEESTGLASLVVLCGSDLPVEFKDGVLVVRPDFIGFYNNEVTVGSAREITNNVSSISPEYDLGGFHRIYAHDGSKYAGSLIEEQKEGLPVFAMDDAGRMVVVDGQVLIAKETNGTVQFEIDTTVYPEEE